MNRQDVFEWVCAAYGTLPDYPWNDNNAVLRHSDSKKWYAVVLEVSKDKLGLTENGKTDIINLKCEPMLMWTLRQQNGYFPAYHMNKESWISVALDGSVCDDDIKRLIKLSYKLTIKKKKSPAVK